MIKMPSEWVYRVKDALGGEIPLGDERRDLRIIATLTLLDLRSPSLGIGWRTIANLLDSPA